MSSLSQFAPFAGGGLKSFQTGWAYATVSYTPGTPPSTEDGSWVDVTISSVNTAKSIPAVYGGIGNESANGRNRYFTGVDYGTLAPTCRLTSATNFRTSINQAGTFPIGFRWQVAEAN